MLKPLLIARNLGQTYVLEKERLEIFHSLDLTLYHGETLFLTGPSGAGKSTLLYTLAGLESPREGTLEFDGVFFHKMIEKEKALLRNQKMGFIFQSYFLLPELTAVENVLLPALFKKHSFSEKKEFQERAKFLLSRVGLEERLLHLPSQLSGGEQQRVAIARALMNKPSLLFADEPTGNLDKKAGELIISLLLDLVKEEKSSLISVTHDPELAQRGDRHLILDKGKLIKASSFEK